MPPLPTAMYFRFHCAGSHSSNFNSGFTKPTTRQKAGTFTGAAVAAAPGKRKSPAATGVADCTIASGSARLVKLSQGCWAQAGSTAEGSARINNVRKVFMAPRR